MGVEDTQPEEAVETPEVSEGTPQEPAAQTWFDGFDDVTKGTAQNKGWKTAEDAVKSYIELQKHLGAPKEKLIRLPDEATPEAMAEVFQKLGRPEDPSGYEIEAPEEAKSLIETYSKFAHEIGLTKDQAKALYEWETKQAQEMTDAEIKQLELSKQAEEKSLKDTWGDNYDQNVSLARHGAKELGVDEDLISAIESKVGYQKTMEMFAKAGERFGEHKFKGGQSPDSQAFTPEGAKAEFERLSTDKTFMEKLNSGDSEARKRINDLIKMGAVR